MKKYIIPITVNSYFALTVIGWLLLFASFILQIPYAWNFIFVFGCHSTFYPFIGILLTADTEFVWLGIALLWFWGLNFIAFAWAYIWAIWPKGYLPITIVALIDTVFSAMITVAMIINTGFQRDHLPLILGVLLSFVVTKLLFRGIADPSNNTEEMLKG